MFIGLSIVAALFAGIEETDGELSRRLLLAAAGALMAGMALKFAARAKLRGIAAAARPARRRDSTGLDVGWAAGGPVGDAPDKRAKAARARRSAAARPNINATHPDSHGPATADGETRRL